jgi:hypothetical protein
MNFQWVRSSIPTAATDIKNEEIFVNITRTYHLETITEPNIKTSPVLNIRYGWRIISLFMVKLKVNLSLCLTKHEAMKMYWGSRRIVPPIIDLTTRWRWVVSFTSLYPRDKRRPYPSDRRVGGPRSRYECGGEEKISYHCPRRVLKPGRPAYKPSLHTDWATSAPTLRQNDLWLSEPFKGSSCCLLYH